jgi:hypothetical protein
VDVRARRNAALESSLCWKSVGTLLGEVNRRRFVEGGADRGSAEEGVSLDSDRLLALSSFISPQTL